MAKSKEKEALGKGIRALLDGIDDDIKPTESLATGHVKQTGVLQITLDQIEVNPFQPRVTFDSQGLGELADSIRIHGVIQPVTVRKIENDKYQLIAGERRLRASKLAKLKSIPAFVRMANDQEMLEIGLIENIQREDLNPIEIALNYQRLIDECNLSHEELAERLGKNRSTVTNYLRLLKLPPDIQMALKKDQLSMGHAKALLSITDQLTQLALYKEILKDGMSVRQIEEAAKNVKSKPKKAQEKKERENELELKRIEDKLSSQLGTRVRIKEKGKSTGELVISYFSNDDLDRIMELINK